MKVQLPIEEGYFHIVPKTFCSLDCYLITPEMDAKWNSNNLHFRSLIVDKEGNVLSCGHKKFFNYLEKPDCYPNPEKFEDHQYLTKQDGTLQILDFVNGQFSMRTRGTVSYQTQENYKDFELLPERYPKVIEFLKENSNYSLLFELVTPNNVIVIRPKEVEFYFLGAVDKNTLKMATPSELAEIWRGLGCPPVPEQYEFNSIADLQSLSEMVKLWKGKEGVVLVYNNGQNRVKLKSSWYNFIHYIKSQLNSINNLIEYYVQNQLPSYEQFYHKIETEFDFEIAEQIKDQLLKISEVGEKVKKDVRNMRDFCQSIRGFENRKQQAEHIMTTYSSRSGYVFNLLDGKELTEQQWNKLIHLELEG